MGGVIARGAVVHAAETDPSAVAKIRALFLAGSPMAGVNWLNFAIARLHPDFDVLRTHGDYVREQNDRFNRLVDASVNPVHRDRAHVPTDDLEPFLRRPS